MSSTEHTPDGEDRSEPTAEELTPSPGAQADIERVDTDPGVGGGVATPGDATTAADRGDLPATGAPAELSSDDGAAIHEGPQPTPTPLPADEGSPESAEATPADVASVGSAAAETAGPDDTAETSSTTSDQPDPAAADEPTAGSEAAAALVEKDAVARAAATGGAPGPTADADAGGPPAIPEPTDASVSPAAEAAGTTEPPSGSEAVGDVPGPAPEPEPETAPEVPEAESEPEVIDEVRQPFLDLLRERLGDAVVGTHVMPGVDVWVRVDRSAWRRAAEICRNELGMTYFTYVSAIDWLPSPFGKSEDGGLGSSPVVSQVPSAELDHGTTGGETRFQLIARLASPTTGIGIHIKADVPDDDLIAESWTGLFAGADWHEREVAEMFGIAFAGHPNLIKLYLPGEFEGFPLRKDFPLLARDVKPWPGLVDVEPLPGEPEPAATDAPADA